MYVFYILSVYSVCCHYQSYSFTEHFASGKGQKQSLRFFAVGDWGGLPFFPYKTFVEEAVAYQMGKLAEKFQANFVISLGDNFYTKGVKDSSDARFKNTFEDVFSAKPLHIPWLISAGNHDHYGNVSGQLEYSKKSKRWKFPSLYYTRKFQVPSSNATVEVLIIDTVLLCGKTDPDAKVPGQPLPYTIDHTQADKQLQWIKKKLKSSKATYLLVCGHYPVYSVAEHGSTDCLLKKLLPMLKKYKVSAYISGHDHNLQHIQPSDATWTVEYFIVGCANYINNEKTHMSSIPSGSLKFFWANLFSLGGFTYVEASVDKMTVTFYESNGNVLYERSIFPRN
ncbi:tartrate-resistant acid phosphatase type 5-like isoform X2 [Limulus polyphemus]|uniref:Tartrate-resistant acid phosphatase type 5 n=1 Tax=Limulus polyphemus TaxID=6850 RepID=A0ABM1TQD9_LIMPO|nr:tartrate-resistant acid phosphatase type 5-like isoform X2 [Limulus polyphemus]